MPARWQSAVCMHLERGGARAVGGENHDGLGITELTKERKIDGLFNWIVT